ncbi:MAG TPA: leucine--tRNA ligase [Candidatus Saccharimonadales bacterium]|nr:leucine--tRNA ligase [Candidatus Saccharimonadales bacterium]
MRRYNPKEIEPKWRKVWEDTKLYEVDTKKSDNKFYIIPMFPYPSGDLHIGHWYNFAPTDTVARWRRMMGHRVLHTNGFDAFGLPAENAAIQRNIPPAQWTRANIESMMKQLEAIGASYDWTKSVTTNDPNYYQWTQWIFLKLFKKKLAYRAKALVNWCPKDQTVLANEQVVGDDNVCERCGTPVVQKEMEQWFFKITDYAERLLKDLDQMDWPARVKHMQTNWIGKSQGALIDFALDDAKEKIEVFTTRPDTIYGATYMVLAPEHPLVEKITTDEQKEDAENYIAEASRKTELERKEAEKAKTGVFTGAYAINPATQKKIPIWVADYVLMSYGTGAIMAVPAHDERDQQFAKKFQLPIDKVIEPVFYQTEEPGAVRKGQPFVERQAITAIVKHWSEDKYIGLKWKTVNWETLITGGVETGQTPEQAAITEIREETGYSNPKLVKMLSKTHAKFYHVPKNENRLAHFNCLYFELADGEQEPVSNSEKKNHEVVWLSAKQLEEFHLPDSHRYIWDELRGQLAPYEGEGIMVNSGKYNDLDSATAREKIVADLAKAGVAKEHTQYRLRDWLISRQRYWGPPIPIIYCDKCGIQPVPEDQLPVLLPENVHFQPTGQSPLLQDEKFVNTKCPNCDGPARRETDTIDTFVDSSWYFLRYPNPHYKDGPFDPEVIKNWGPVDHYIGGIEHAILHLLYARFITRFLHDHYNLPFEEPFKKLSNQGIILGPDGHKMSKSRGNVVSPDEQVTSYGADSLRLYLMFMGPYDQGGPYSMGGIAGTRRFLERVWSLTLEFKESSKSADGHNSELEVQINRVVHKAIKKVSQDIEQLGFNTAIAALMECINSLYKLKTEHNFALAQNAWEEALIVLVQLVAPFAPHISEELWGELGQSGSVHVSKWPAWDATLITEEIMTLAVQINGKVRAEIDVPTDITESDVIKEAKKDKKVAELLSGKTVKKTIYVPGRLVSLVI